MTIKVELFALPGCQRCAGAKRTLQQIVESFGNDCIAWRPVDVLREIDYAVSLGVLATPAIAIDGVLVFTGLPGAATLRREIDQRLAGWTRTGTLKPDAHNVAGRSGART